MNESKIKEPLFHISRRSELARWKAWAIRLAGIILALVVCGVVVFALTKLNPVRVYGTMWEGAFGSSRKTLRHTAGLGTKDPCAGGGTGL